VALLLRLRRTGGLRGQLALLLRLRCTGGRCGQVARLSTLQVDRRTMRNRGGKVRALHTLRDTGTPGRSRTSELLCYGHVMDVVDMLCGFVNYCVCGFVIR
jgi:hypothetical protein